MGNDKRFVEVYSQGAIDFTRILVDRETGVNYIFAKYANAGGLSVLVGADGKPIVTPIH